MHIQRKRPTDDGLQEGPDGLQPFAVKLVGVHVLEDGIALERMGEGLEEGMGNEHGGLRGETFETRKGIA